MKKLFTFFKATTLLLALLCSLKVSAQISNTFKMDPTIVRTYSYLSTGTRVSAIEVDEGTANIPLGFTFKMGSCGATVGFTNVQVSSNGWLRFLGTAASSAISNAKSATGYTNAPSLGPLWANLSGDGGTAMYETELLPSGLRVFTMEWKNWKWDPTATSACVSFQVKLYEGSNIIEYCYKRESGSIVGTSKATVSIVNTSVPNPLVVSPTGYDYMIFTDVSATPVLNRTGAWGQGLTDVPPDNQIYQFYQACCGKPTAGVIGQPDSVCACAPFTAKLSGATPAPFPKYGIEYQWQTASSAAGPWTNIALPDGRGTSQYFSGICAGIDTFVRVIIKCDSSNLSDTTPVKQIKLITLPYNCYCYSSATQDDNQNNANIGNVKIITKGNDTLLNNVKGGGVPGFVNKGPYRPYTLFTGLRPIVQLNRDTTYKFSVMGMTRDTFAFSSSGVALYIDYNHDGAYDASSELAAFQVISGTSSKFITTFTVPSTAKLNDTLGMRVVMKKGSVSSTTTPPCGSYLEGETEDYLVQIVNPKCPGPLSAGVAYITDTSICDGYSTTIWDTAHAKNMTGMHWEWEYSLDNVIWANVPSSKFMDTIQPIVRQSTYYRLRSVCELTKDTIYSNKVYIKLKQPYKCYCHSIANGSNGMDSSDISAYKIGPFYINTGGPHLNNPESIRKRTDYTDLPAVELYSLDRYQIGVYHTMKTTVHADARISVFMDFNHNLKYDGASELIWSHVTSASDFFPHDSITIPAAVIPNVETGMRVVLNNDLGTSNPSDLGCDEFVSGEIEDYLVIFRRRTTGIGEVTSVDNLQIYPNPNNGQFTVSFNATKTIAEASITVTTITGQEVYNQHYTNVSNAFIKNISLVNQASGVYFITVTTDGQKSVNKLIIR